MIYAVGDIHGQATMLASALDHLRTLLQPGDRVIFLGDYIDRGNDSHGVLSQLRRFQRFYPDAIFLKGNHEELFLEAFESADPETEMLWLMNGGMETLLSYDIAPDANWREHFPADDLAFLRATEMEYVGRYFHFVHAGLLPPRVRWSLKKRRDPRLWIRNEFIDSDYDFGRMVVFGHTPQPSGIPLVMHNKIGLDTGAVFGGPLTVAAFDDAVEPVDGSTLQIFQVTRNETETEAHAA